MHSGTLNGVKGLPCITDVRGRTLRCLSVSTLCWRSRRQGESLELGCQWMMQECRWVGITQRGAMMWAEVRKLKAKMTGDAGEGEHTRWRECSKTEGSAKRFKCHRQVNAVNYWEAQSRCNSQTLLINVAEAVAVECQRQKSVSRGLEREGDEKMR